jgi:preprotein translocase subunit SecF
MTPQTSASETVDDALPALANLTAAPALANFAVVLLCVLAMATLASPLLAVWLIVWLVW